MAWKRRGTPKSDTPGVETIDSIENVEISFESNLQYQIRLIQQDFNFLGSLWERQEREMIKDTLANDIRTFELLIVGKIEGYGRDKYNEDIEKIRQKFRKAIRKTEKSDDIKEEDKPYELLELRIEYFREKFQLLVRIAQTEQSNVGRL